MTDNTHWRDSCPTNKEKTLYMYRNEIRTDCTFVVGEEKKVFRAHIFVLSLVSYTFDRMFYGDVKQDKDNICIPDIEPGVFQAFLNAIYLEEVAPTSFEEACNLLDLASKYMIKWMKDQCLAYIVANITPSNAVAGYEVVSLYDADLASCCWKLIQEDTAQVLASEDFIDVGKETLVRILGEDKLAVQSEGELVSAVQRWVDADLQRQGKTEDAERLKLLKEFIPHIRFLSMSVKEFLSFSERTSLFSWKECDSILMKIVDPNSFSNLPPNVSLEERVFLPKKKTRPSPASSGSSSLEVPLPGDWKEQLYSAAVDGGDVGELRRLQAAGADLSVRYGRGWTLLHLAAVYGHAECVQWLLEQGLSPHSTTGAGWTPLHRAAYGGRLETVRLLLDSGADPAARNSNGRTALDLAISEGNSAVADLLRHRT